MENPWHDCASIIFRENSHRMQKCVTANCRFACHCTRHAPSQFAQPPTLVLQMANGNCNCNCSLRRVQLKSCQSVACKTLVMRADCETNNVLSPARSGEKCLTGGGGGRCGRGVTCLALPGNPVLQDREALQLQSTIDCKSHVLTANVVWPRPLTCWNIVKSIYNRTPLLAAYKTWPRDY